MKKKALLFGTLPVLALAAGMFFINSDDEKGAYQPRATAEFANPTLGERFELYELMKGDVSKENWERIRAQANAIPQNRATFNWIDEGPDNIGGRTRAIAIDRTNQGHIYAGSVSGGLFESVTRANNWTRVEEFTSNLAISSICQTPDGVLYVATGHLQERVSGTSGSVDSGANGDGVYKRAADLSWSVIPGTEDFTFINEIVSDDVNNIVWMATNDGLKKYDPVTDVLYDIDGGIGGGTCTSLAISKDGTLLVVNAGAGTKTYVSTDGGVTFSDRSDGDLPNPIGTSGSRFEYAISHERLDGNYVVYCSAASSFLTGVYRSADNGMNWSLIAPGHNQVTGPLPGTFAPFSSGGNGQGTYDNIITVVPGSPNRILLGGIDCYTWALGTVNWKRVSQWFYSPTSFKYVHADNHEMVWDNLGRLYIGNDGGISFSDNAKTSIDPDFHHANRGYNVTQFYAMGFSAHGDVIGGAQDNGTTVNYHDNSTWSEHKRYGGGDGFTADISFINRNLAFGTVYFASMYRSNDRGANASTFGPDLESEYGCVTGMIGGTGCGSFYTVIELWENPNDLASEDSIKFIPQRAYETGENVEVPSMTSQMIINYTSPIDVVFDDTLYFDPSLTEDDPVVRDLLTGAEFNLDIVEFSFISGAPDLDLGDSLLIVALNDTIIIDSIYAKDHYYGSNPDRPGQKIDMGDKTHLSNISWDTLTVQDPYQSWFALGLGDGQGIWMTRNALRFSAPREDWILVADGLSAVSTLEFSKDGDYLFAGTWNGQLYRLTGYNGIYSPEAGVDTLMDIRETDHTQITSFERIGNFSGAPVTGIASGAIDDPDHLAVSLGLFGEDERVLETTIATGVAAAVSSSWSDMNFPAGIPCYGIVIERNDPNTMLVATEFGVYATETGGSSWENVSGDFGNTPVHDIGQNWRTWDEGCYRPGEIYIGTHGRGIWSTSTFLGTTKPIADREDEFKSNLLLYPNPAVSDATISFDLESDAKATVQVFNLNGQVVLEIQKENLSAGNNLIKFGVDQLTTGTYIVRLTTGSSTSTTKFIKK